MVTKPDVLVAKEKMLVTVATVSVAISSLALYAYQVHNNINC